MLNPWSNTDIISNIAVYADDTTIYSKCKHLICGNN